MSNRDILECAAKAAGLDSLTEWTDRITDHDSPHWGDPALYPDIVGGECHSWNPLLNDGDAFRLMVRLRLSLSRADREDALDAVNVYDDSGSHLAGELMGPDHEACQRRAITLAAARLGGYEG